MKPPATNAARMMREKLLRLAECDTAPDGERMAALDKIQRIERRYDFSGEPPPMEEDIFAGLKGAHWSTPSGTSRKLATFANEHSELASFAKWTLETQLGARCTLRTPPDGIELFAETPADHVRKLQHICAMIERDFLNLWNEYASRPGSEAGARRVFLGGLYDGMADDPRKPGTLLPPVSAPRMKRERRKRAVAVAPGLAIHPYTLAVELGRQIRLSTPIATVTKTLKERTAQLADHATT